MRFFLLSVLLLLSSHSYAGLYDFNYKDEENMKGAYYICLPSGFLLGDCDTVFEKCWQEPLLRYEFGTFGVKVTSVCLDMPKLSVADDEIHDTVNEARNRAFVNNGIMVDEEDLGGEELDEAINADSNNNQYSGTREHLDNTAADVAAYELQYNELMQEFETRYDRVERWNRQLKEVQLDYQTEYNNGTIQGEWKISGNINDRQGEYLKSKIEEELERLDEIDTELKTLATNMTKDKLSEIQVADGVDDNSYMTQYGNDADDYYGYRAENENSDFEEGDRILNPEKY